MARVYRSEYERRNAKARELGYRSYRDMRDRRAAGEPLPGDQPGRRQVVPTPVGTIVRTTEGGRGLGVLESRIRNSSGQVKLLVKTKSGDTLEVYGKGGRSAKSLAGAMAGAGSLASVIVGDIAAMYAGLDLDTDDIADIQVVIR